MGALFLEACLEKMQHSEFPCSTFVLNTDSKYRDDEGSLFRSDHLSYGYMSAITKFIHALPFKKLVLEGIHPTRTHTLSDSNYAGILEGLAASSSALEKAHIDAAYDAQTRTKEPVNQYQQDFFDRFKTLLENASSELEVVVVQNASKEKNPTFSMEQLEELVQWAGEKKITTYIEDANPQAYSSF
jgi:hypothetical protein